MEIYTFKTSIGILTAIEKKGRLISLKFCETSCKTTNSEILLSTETQINEYLSGRRRHFDIPVSFCGTDFQKKVWFALLDIDYGETKCYGDIADFLGVPSANRAVGNAVGANPIAIIVPCHRVIRKNGDLGNYAYGKEIKKDLLHLEEKNNKKAV